MDTLRECTYNSNSLCRAVNFHIDDSEMLQLNSRILTQTEIQTGPNHQAKIRIGRIPLDGHLFTLQPISHLAITYFGTNFQRNKQHVERFIDNLVGVSLFNAMRKHHSIYVVRREFLMRCAVHLCSPTRVFNAMRSISIYVVLRVRIWPQHFTYFLL